MEHSCDTGVTRGGGGGGHLGHRGIGYNNYSYESASEILFIP